MHLDRLGVPVKVGDIVAVTSFMGSGVGLARVIELLNTDIPKLRAVGLRTIMDRHINAKHTLVVNAQMDYVKDHYPELVL